ncbi:single-stranded DNA-binding protein [Pseudaquabacterium pictum]|uniref:Single-stranded DNA-binding protein n=1 Tax=Pseudaquabacterium pictum TaxID=2315236 RepID=A0A480AUC8_9BURK|nr:single-stranded DNA-binding protein [Rubrivivax pictus]GCL64953.1 hypothetical protein AQPW35_40340 [Rubrivivax pictus]
MSVTALVTGKLIADPDRRSGTGRKPYVLAKMIAHDGEADSLVSLIAFGSTAEQIGSLSKGDALAVNGRAKVKTWQDRDGATKAGLSITADAVMTAYQLTRKRQAVASASAPRTAQTDTGSPPWGDDQP